MRRLSLLGFAYSALVAVPCAAQTLLFDFGRTDLQSGPGWNNVVPATTLISPVVDDSGTVFGSTQLAITDTFFQTGEPSRLGSEAPTGDASAFPVSATDDYLFGHTVPFAGAGPNPLGQFTLSGLDTSLIYDFTFFASRQVVNDTREARYTVRGATTASVVLNASNNDSEVAVVTGVLPDASGAIVVDTEPGPANDNGSGFYYLGLVQVIASSGDADQDGIPDAADNCPADPNPLQADADLDLLGDVCDHCPDWPSMSQPPVNGDFDGNGIGDECECGDQTEDGLVNVIDLLSINSVIFEVIPASPLCDTNNDDVCDVRDILGANAKIFGEEAYCERYPPPAP